MERVFNVYAKIKHTDGKIEKRRLWLEKLTRADADYQAGLAVKYNQGVVLKAWVEPADQQKGIKR